MVALMIAGAAMIPLLSVQLQPAKKTRSLSVSCSWPGASPAIMEKEVVSKLEGVLARLDGVEEITSVSNFGSGMVTLLFKEGTKMEVARFEAASQIRALYPQFPEGVSYPLLNVSTGGESGGETFVAGYTINTSLSGQDAERYIVDNLLPALSRLEGVNSVRYGGIRPYEYEITVDPDAALSAGVEMNRIATAFNDYFGETTVGNVTYGDGNVILLKARMSDRSADFSAIPVANAEGRIVLLGELATVIYRQSLPLTYSRINGLNVIHLSVSAHKNTNVVKLSSEVKAVVTELEPSFPKGFTAQINYDAADYINKELHTIFLRTLMTVVILMLFVLAVSRNRAYLLMIFVTLLANILAAVIFYYLLGLQIHLYSLAGITVSLGIIIDTSIIMVDHYSYYRDRKAFLAILGAVLTTIASLTVVFLLPVQQQLIFGDFAWVIIINLAVSLAISLFFIPALLDCFPLKKPMTVATMRMKRFVARYNRSYSAFTGWGRRHRWLFITVLILGFGLPIHLLPPQWKPGRNEEPTMWQKWYNETVGGKLYQNNKAVVEKVLGGSFRLFDTRKSPAYGGNPEQGRITLTIRAGMVEGNTVHQLNEIVRYMENYLSRFEEIESFRTTVSSYDNSTITVTFKPEYEKGSFPYQLHENAQREAMRFGGATWSIYGLPDLHFSNNTASYGQYKPYRIVLTGYNYDQLMRYAEGLRDSLSRNRRVDDPGIYGEVSWDASRRKQEFFVEMDREKALMTGASLGGYFGMLNQLLYERPLRPVFTNGKNQRVLLSSSKKSSFDLWRVKNDPLAVDSVRVKLSDFGTVDKQFTGLSIYKRNQSYQLIVAFDFIGSGELAGRLIKTQVDRLNDYVLPIGYLANRDSGGRWYGKAGANYSFLLILLVIAIIYVVCAILFESLKKPLVIILMIPVSFIGVFLTFGLFGFRFDQGGFASLVLLSGLVVNAGIYVINEYNIISRHYTHRKPLPLYMKAYSRKIVPILLTIVSTVLGLIPFVTGGKDDLFWYSFAVGTMGGMLFSVVAFLVYLPLFLPLKKGDDR
jgi:multidrug efflux pump subunit AcrB